MATYLPPPKSLQFNLHYFRNSQFYGYISDTTLTVVNFDISDLEGLTTGSTVAGPGVILGTYITGITDPILGIYTISPSQTIGSSGSPTTMTAIPTSLQPIFATLNSNEYLVRGTLGAVENFSAFVYNPGTQTAVNYYDAYNVIPSDWIASSASGYTWRISDIYSVFDAGLANNSGPIPATEPSGIFYAKIVDIDLYNAGIDPAGSFNGAPTQADTLSILFTLDEDGFPIFTPSNTSALDPNFAGNVIGRFRALNVKVEYVSINQTGASSTFAVGDPIYLDPIDGLFKLSSNQGDVELIYTTIGVVTSVNLPTPNDFSFNPLGEFREALDLIPLGITGAVGTYFYINPNAGSHYTTVKPTVYAFPIYQIIDSAGNAILLSAQHSNGPTGVTGTIGSTGTTGPSG
jgi:hypothetical protein